MHPFQTASSTNPAPQPNTPSVFDYFTKAILPIIAIIAAPFIKDSVAVRSVLGLGLASILIGLLLPKLKGWWGRKAELNADRRFIAMAFPQLQAHARKCEKFTNTRSSDTLYYICNELFEHNSDRAQAVLGVGSPYMFSCLFDSATVRLNSPPPTSVQEFRLLVSDFNNALSLFCRFYAGPIFERIPACLKDGDAVRYDRRRIESSLVTFREGFIKFIDDYKSWLDGLNHNSGCRLNVSDYFEAPKPLAKKATA